MAHKAPVISSASWMNHDKPYGSISTLMFFDNMEAAPASHKIASATTKRRSVRLRKSPTASPNSSLASTSFLRSTRPVNTGINTVTGSGGSFPPPGSAISPDAPVSQLAATIACRSSFGTSTQLFEGCCASAAVCCETDRFRGPPATVSH